MGDITVSRESALVTADWVEENLDNDNVVLIEVDEDTTAYDKNHIRNAITFNWHSDLTDPVRHDVLKKEQFEALLSANGITNDDTIVLYGGNNNWFAAYAYWEFKLYGVENVKLLDGGRKKWELDARELVTDVPVREEATFVAPAHLPQEQSQTAGHIPTAANIPWSKAANDDGTFRSDAELKELYEAEGVDLGKDTIAYCRIGERSSHTWFVLQEILGVPNVKNYDGSWTEYGSLIGVPVQLGAVAGSPAGGQG
jgi:thiosulfate/3-mercaptopyruvate sulfurtransferase